MVWGWLQESHDLALVSLPKETEAMVRDSWEVCYRLNVETRFWPCGRLQIVTQHFKEIISLLPLMIYY